MVAIFKSLKSFSSISIKIFGSVQLHGTAVFREAEKFTAENKKTLCVKLLYHGKLAIVLKFVVTLCLRLLRFEITSLILPSVFLSEIMRLRSTTSKETTHADVSCGNDKSVETFTILELNLTINYSMH